MSDTLRLDAFAIDRASKRPLHHQLYERIHVAIGDGRLPPGTRLPSTRSLSIQLGVARGTVDAVYARLAGEGRLTARRPGGTVVSPGLRPPSPPPPAPRPEPSEPWLPLQLGLPALDLFPRKTWTRILARQARQLPVDEMIAPDPMGLAALREAIVAYLAVSRGVTCGADQIVITHGYQDALNLTVDLVLAEGDKVWIEDPGYGFVQRTLRARNMTVVATPVDEAGLRVDCARARAPDARLAIVTPAHQFPLGVTLSQARRLDLLAWATETGRWILEDDYDCEFHYSGHKPAALKAIDVDQRVFYAGSFSKSLLPSLRLGYLVLPPQLTSAAAEAQQLRHRGVAMFEQLAVAELMRQGHFARHLRRMAVRYKARRNALVAALEHRFGDRITLAHRAGGLHVLARFPRLDDDVALARRALAVGLKPAPLSGQHLTPGEDQGLLMSFTNVPEERADEIVARLAGAIE
jgi:GntR family transcriptional regulator/MocR family aminotransferase